MSFKDISHNPERITSDDGNGWELLAAAIIEQAVKDYRISFFRQDSKEADVRKQAKQRMNARARGTLADAAGAEQQTHAEETGEKAHMLSHFHDAVPF